MGVHITPWEWAILRREGEAHTKCRDTAVRRAKWLNHLTCLLGCGSDGPKKSCTRWGPDPHGKRKFWGEKGGPLQSIVTLCLDLCKNRLNQSRCCLGYGLGWAQGSMCYMGVHIVATWRIWLNRPCAAAIRPSCRITLTTCCCCRWLCHKTLHGCCTKTAVTCLCRVIASCQWCDWCLEQKRV